MKFVSALVATVSFATATSLQSSSMAQSGAEAEAGWDVNTQYQGTNYFRHPGYQQADYSVPYGETLPGPDFNRQVYNFDESQQIWDQNDYEERVKMEAEILVALESLKDSIMYIQNGINQIADASVAQNIRIGSN